MVHFVDVSGIFASAEIALLLALNFGVVFFTNFGRLRVLDFLENWEIRGSTLSHRE